jgi:hypothetical protein
MGRDCNSSSSFDQQAAFAPGSAGGTDVKGQGGASWDERRAAGFVLENSTSGRAARQGLWLNLVRALGTLPAA